MITNMDKNRFTIYKLPRQVNQQLLFLICYIMQYLILILSIAILANKSSTARDILSRLQLAYENLPRCLQQVLSTGTKVILN